jgi:hypothetical protein
VVLVWYWCSGNCKCSVIVGVVLVWVFGVSVSV